MGAKEKYEGIIKYLSKNYVIKDCSFFVINDPHKEEYTYIVDSLVKIFSYNKNFCRFCLKRWSVNNGLSYEEWVRISVVRFSIWSPEMARDLQGYYNIDAEAELTAMLSEQVAGEIDRNILNKIFHLK
jgi:hypothetical protein